MPSYFKIKTISPYWAAIELKKHLPWLSKVSVDDITDQIRKSDIKLVCSKRKKSPWWARLVMIPLIAVIIVLVVFMPVKFIITGEWGYKWKWLSNWIKATGF